MNMQLETVTVLDGLAAQLAGMAGVNWERLHNHPGYERNYWRDKARAVISGMDRAVAPPRRQVECSGGWCVTN
jgi:hypothetical protein